MVVATFLLYPKIEHQQSVNDSTPCILENAWAVQRRDPIIALLAAFLGKNSCNNITIVTWKYASTERQWLLALHYWKYYGCAATLKHNQIISCLSRQKRLRRHRNDILKMSVKWAWTTFGHASWIVWWQCGDINTQSNYRPSFWAKILSTTSSLYPTREYQQCINDLGAFNLENSRGYATRIIHNRALF
jgi:hypothetical protein